MKRFNLRTGSIAVAALLSASAAFGQFSTLEDGNSLVHFDTANPGNRIGMDQWVVDGMNHMYNQWFWYRVGDVGPENRINTLPETFRGTFNTNADPRDDTLTIRYTNPGLFEIEATWRVQGGALGSGTSDVAEQIRITNLTQSPLPFHFFQYCDLDLNSDILDDFAQIGNPPHNNTVVQTDGLLTVSETVDVPDPFHWEVNTYANTITRLDDLLPDVLNDVAGPLPGGRLDYTWAFEWDPVIAANGSFLISKDKHIVPAPGSVALLAAAGAFGLRRRRR